jgi:aspartate dehydrogenase
MPTKKLKIGIVGCGAIGSNLAVILKKSYADRVSLSAFCDVDAARAKALRQRVRTGVVTTLAGAIAKSDLVVEAASAGASFDIASRALARGKDVLVMSIGGILGREKRLFESARRHKARLLFPSGAIAGIDGIKALSIAGIRSVVLRTSKPPQGLAGASYVVQNHIQLDGLTGPKRIFEGEASEAVKAFPQNINVVALLSLVTGGRPVPRVEIWAVPGSSRNVHEISVVAQAADLHIRCENLPSPENPKTSYLAILSAVRVIADVCQAVRMGN